MQLSSFVRFRGTGGARRPVSALAATIMVGAAIVGVGATATAAVAPTADIVVHAGGVRTGASTVGGLDGATFQAIPVGGGAAVTCTTNAVGTCTMTVPTGTTSATRVAYVVSEQAAPAGWYLNPALDYGSSTSINSTPYAFQTARLVAGSSTDVPGPSAAGSYNDAASPGKPFSGQLATSLANPSAPSSCGLKIALILDQSGSMAGSKQTDLKLAAKKVISTLTGTPSQLAVYTFAAGTGGSVGLTSLATAGSAAALTNFITNLPTPAGATNWDQGLYQAVTATKQYDLVVVLTDGNPTTDHNGEGGGSTTTFHSVENGIYSANAIKHLGSRLVAVGIGVAGGQQNLRAISGPDVDSDYYLGTTGTFDEVFKTLATGNCDGVLTVQNRIQDFQGNLMADSAAANGWDFAGPGTFPATASVNGTTGFTQTTATIAAGSTPTVTVTEALVDGYTFVGASCSVNGAAVTTTPAGTATHPGVSFTATAGVPLSCTFTNQQPAPLSSLAVQKLDATTNLPVGGATFQLFREATAGTRNPAVDTAVGAPCTTSGNPAQCASDATLTFGSYYWVEAAAAPGYVLPSGDAAYSAAYQIDATHTGAPAATLYVADEQLKSALTVRKTDADGTVLAGATFQLWRDSNASAGLQRSGGDPDTDAGQCTTGAAGTCSVDGLVFGTYYWVETEAPLFYELPANPVSPAGSVTAGNAGSAFEPTVFVDPATPVPTVTKTVQSTTQNPDGSWTVVYDVAVSNPSSRYATTYELTDTLAFGAGIDVDSATVAGPANPSWDGAGQPVVSSGRTLAANSTDDYTVTVRATVHPGADRDCATGGGFANTSHVALQARTPNGFVVHPPLPGSTDQDASACSEPVSPVLGKSFDSAVQHLVDGAWDGTWDVMYTVTVTNPSVTTTLSYALTDLPDFPADVTVNGGTVTGTDGTDPIAGVSADWDGTINTQVVSARALAPAGTDTYSMTVNATVPADADPAELSCSAGESGHGFFSEASLVSGGDTLASDACGDIAALPMPTVEKTVTGNEQNADGTWTITYDIAVTNPDGTRASEYDLSDALDFGTGLTIATAAVTGPAGADINGDWTGVDDTAIVAGRTIAAGDVEHYTVTVSGTVSSTASATDRDCTLASDESGTGFRNEAALLLGSQRATSTACAVVLDLAISGQPIDGDDPINSIDPTDPAPQAVNPGSGLAYTGVPVGDLISLGIAFLIIGVGLLLLIGRRRKDSGPVR